MLLSGHGASENDDENEEDDLYMSTLLNISESNFLDTVYTINGHAQDEYFKVNSGVRSKSFGWSYEKEDRNTDDMKTGTGRKEIYEEANDTDKEKSKTEV